MTRSPLSFIVVGIRLLVTFDYCSKEFISYVWSGELKSNETKVVVAQKDKVVIQ